MEKMSHRAGFDIPIAYPRPSLTGSAYSLQIRGELSAAFPAPRQPAFMTWIFYLKFFGERKGKEMWIVCGIIYSWQA